MSETIQYKGKELGIEPEALVTIQAHHPDKGIDLGNELAAKIVPVILDLQAAGEAAPDDGASMADRLAYEQAKSEALKGLLRAMPGAELRQMAKRVLAHTRVAKEVKGETRIFDLGGADFGAYFQRNYDKLIPLMRTAIEFNGFLGLDVSGLLRASDADTTESDAEATA
jgi:hypothetical protein